MKLLTLTQLAELAGASDTSLLRKDIKAKRLRATKLGKTWLVKENEAQRWIKDEWPTHIASRDKPIGAKSKKSAKS